MKHFFQWVFINREYQVRSGWKIGLIILTYLVCIITWQDFFPAKSPTDLGYNVADTLIFGGIIFGVLQWFDRKNFNHIGLTDIRSHFPDLGLGLIVGAVSMALIFVILTTSGQIGVKTMELSPDVFRQLGNGLLLFTMVGLREELFCRGYCLFALGQMRRIWLAVLLSALIFTLLHATNPNLQLIGLLNIFLAALLFSYMTIKTGNLWMAIGFHITWDYFQGSIFGFPVSGIQINSLYHTQIRESNLLTGGSFGPEAGLLVTGMFFFGFVIVWFYTKGRKITYNSFWKPSLKPPFEPLPAVEKPEKHQEYC